jgi:CubicO group peptidase (beta-lactamase class C family)
VTTPIDGWCAPGFAPVREAFAANFTERGEVGAAVHVIVCGEVVVDLVGGWADEDRTRPWRRDTIVDVYSVGKAILALLVLQLVDDGRLALDEPRRRRVARVRARRQGRGHRRPRAQPRRGRPGDP